MLTNAQLSWHLRKMFPGTQNGVDFLVGQETDVAGNQTADAKIYQWMRDDIKQPDDSVIRHSLAVHGKEYELVTAAATARDQRVALLTEADRLIHIAEDAGQTDRLPALRAYRQALRDVPAQAGFPATVEWPTLPTEKK
jgi:hypothetical protein